jgi:hypothetical protein
MQGATHTMGRRRKPGVIRDASGKSRGERPDDIMSVVLAQRYRVVEPRDAKNSLAGSTLGRMLLAHQRRGYDDPQAITQKQFEAGEAFAAAVRRHAAVMGYSISRPSPSFQMVGTGVSCRPEPDEDVIMAAKRRFSECYNALMKAGVDTREGVAVALIVYAVCVQERALESLSRHDIGNLRVGLNALVRVLG